MSSSLTATSTAPQGINTISASSTKITTEPRRIAVIGAGISGIATAAHLLQQNRKHGNPLFDVTIFERSEFVGGVWEYDTRRPIEPGYPNDNLDYESARLRHAPPGPAYKGLRNNVPTSLMHSTLLAWPEGTEDFVGQELIVNYIRDLAEITKAKEHLVLGTSVESIWKEETRESDVNPIFSHATHEFDAVVVASGHYHVPRVPDIPGLKGYRDAFPETVTHAKGYRTPEQYIGSTVLIIGSSASSHDISKELALEGKTVYVSSRGGQWDIGAPEPAIRVGGIESFEVKRGIIRFRDGNVLHDIDHVILATGYLTSYPFLGPRLQNPEVPAEQADDKIVVTRDGLLTHNLHRDIWYIPDPSLAFVGVVFHTSTFSMFDFQGSVVAKVLAGEAELPSKEIMRAEYIARKAAAFAAAGPAAGNSAAESVTANQQQQQSLRSFHSLMGRETVYIDEVLDWVNSEARRLGLPEMKALSEKWYRRYDEFREQIKARRLALAGPPTGGVVFGPLERAQREQAKGTELVADNARAEAYKRLESEAGQAVTVAH
ncbi:uncharacterized protein B0I36DRAFT_232798 [Microdochium trichocladiopsis]|uniref:Uncharacterized protein n=1 Tax=Microdochium trichocladiopsis TaxID=1682393 RepID=A0A9P9BZE4_9PEZI|nr:uncharacterized protein B0I36DRAFT_232798 [Microdochium trichocladiopsis]KAH7040019.1 hypothetical protein B0I36DRAFT_232798 [Microdochium trichocladiopsis]